MNKLIISSANLEQFENITSPPTLSKFARFKVPKGTYIEIPAYTPGFFKPAMVETFVGDGSNKTFTLKYLPVDPSVVKVYLFNPSNGSVSQVTNFTVNGNTVTLATAPSNGVRVDIYYASLNQYVTVGVEVEMGVNVKSYKLAVYDIGLLALMNQFKEGERFFFTSRFPLVEDMSFCLYAESDVRFVVKNIRNGQLVQGYGVSIEAYSSDLLSAEVASMYKGQPRSGVLMYYETSVGV